jgi:pyruvyltransferase
MAIGSIVSYATEHSVVWGSGAFGTESLQQLEPNAQYLAVRGPLTRNLLRIHGIRCPPVYGDPALLVPSFVGEVPPTDVEIGLCVRWSERGHHFLPAGDGVQLINFGNPNVEEVLSDLLRCRRIATTSLHGLILADAFGKPSAWISSGSPKSFEFKFYDYFASVDKVRHSQPVNLSRTGASLFALDSLSYDHRPIQWDSGKLLSAAPWALLPPRTPGQGQ